MKRWLFFLILLMLRLSVLGQVKSNNLPEYGIVLSGGGALGYAHVGVLMALEEAGITASVVSGASMGALVGALYAYGCSPQEMINILEHEKLYKKSKIFTIRLLNKKGLSTHKKLEKILNKILPVDSFDSLNLFFAVSMTNLIELKTEYAFSGNKLKEKIMASATIPSLFEPKEIDGIVYIDGGVTNNIPIEPIIGKCEKIIIVDVLAAGYKNDISGRVKIAYRGYLAMMKQANIDRINQADYYVGLEKLEKYNIFDFAKYKEIIKIGYDGMKEFLRQHSELINTPQR